MAMPTYASVTEYLAAQPAPTRRVLVAIRRAVRKALPGAEESISYGIPTYKRDGRVVIYFAGWKQHVSLYPASPAIVAACAKALAPFEVEKGTIRFPLGQPVPAKLVERIARLRAKEAAAPKAKPSTATKATKAPKPSKATKAKAKAKAKAKR
jgi:uncharacterized protein YdhG (YjbR/CyaY superfamily)